VAPAGLGIGLALLPFLILVVVGTFMLGGREQVEAIREEMAAEESDR
jgi:energy-coupling factor transport system substrate-specific component